MYVALGSKQRKTCTSWQGVRKILNTRWVDDEVQVIGIALWPGSIIVDPSESVNHSERISEKSPISYLGPIMNSPPALSLTLHFTMVPVCDVALLSTGRKLSQVVRSPSIWSICPHAAFSQQLASRDSGSLFVEEAADHKARFLAVSLFACQDKAVFRKHILLETAGSLAHLFGRQSLC